MQNSIIAENRKSFFIILNTKNKKEFLNKSNTIRVVDNSNEH